jgi:hypothetical protein
MAMRQVVPVFTRFVQMAFANNRTRPQSKLPPKDANLNNGHENGFGFCLRSMGPGTVAGKGKIISIGTRLDSP